MVLFLIVSVLPIVVEPKINDYIRVKLNIMPDNTLNDI